MLRAQSGAESRSSTGEALKAWLRESSGAAPGPVTVAAWKTHGAGDGVRGFGRTGWAGGARSFLASTAISHRFGCAGPMLAAGPVVELSCGRPSQHSKAAGSQGVSSRQKLLGTSPPCSSGQTVPGTSRRALRLLMGKWPRGCGALSVPPPPVTTSPTCLSRVSKLDVPSREHGVRPWCSPPVPIVRPLAPGRCLQAHFLALRDCQVAHNFGRAVTVTTGARSLHWP